MMLYKNRKAMVRSSDGDTNFFDIVARVLQVLHWKWPEADNIT